MSALMPTDLPCPVAPAISKCGIVARSTMKCSLSIFLPRAIGSAKVLFWNFSDDRSPRIPTMLFFTFGTSMPMVPFPGIGAMIRMPSAERLSAMSSSRFLMREMRTPAAGTISYSVTVGPTVAKIFCIAIS